MAVIRVEKINEVHLRVFCDDFGVESELSDFFTFEFPGAKFTPKFRARLWDGKIRLYDQLRKTLYTGLLAHLLRFIETEGHTLEALNELSSTDGVEVDDVEQYAESLNLCSKGERIEIRDYQIDAVHTALNDARCMLLSPTGSGKSLIIYTIARWHIENNRKVLLVVPSTSLVEQMYSDFEDYSSENGWDVDGNCQKLYSGFTKTFSKNILFTTWQSIYQLPKQWFSQFDVIVGDEAHQFKAKSLTTIMEKLVDTRYKIGTTGSLDDKKVNRLVLEGIFGKIHKVTTTNRLQNEGRLAQLKIVSVLLKYEDELRKDMAKASYQDEVQFLVKSETRNKFIRNLSLKCKGNTIVLFNFVDHGQVLFDMIKERADGRSVYFIHGGVDVKERERIRKKLGTETDAIVVASFGTMSTGINIPSIENIVFSSPFKSIIRALQSIGRGLRLNKGKTHCNLFDLTDDLHWKTWKNHTLRHGADRYKIYTGEQFSVKMVEVSL